MAAHRHARSDSRALALALALVLGFAGVEAAAGLVSGSLALLADAGHMLSDGLALGLALAAAALARRPATPRRSFGWRRAEILAALANGVVLVVLALLIVLAAVRRLSDPPEVEGAWVLATGSLGLVVNLVAARILHGAGDGLNVRAALLHVLADLASSVGVVVAGTVVLLTGWQLVDPLVGLLIGVLVLLSTRRVLTESVAVLLEAAPRGLDVDALSAELRAVDGVVGVHDLHVWTITSGFPALSAHVLVEPRADCHSIRRDLEVLLRERFALTHTTLQVEHAPGLLKLSR
ncbi:MAG TPA: cation diffusion facilitator family transporter [Gaiellaceae bacterium]|jgi:cobalt-zinc-cadmium efflux system protein|nr:cation diffusion facilitator family transporter [Gaiellaceae bacterium]